MIRHRPFGLGHPYRHEPDQRVPGWPIAGEPIELRATTDATIDSLNVEVTIDGVVRTMPLERVPDATHAATTDRPDAASPRSAGDGSPSASGHLTRAAERAAGSGRRAWRHVLPPLRGGSRLTYRFRADRGATRPFSVTVAAWSSEGGSLRVLGSRDSWRVSGPLAIAEDLLVPGSLAWLRGDRGPIRGRFALRLPPGAHVVGFGERFDRIDQAGMRLDATVFEQYKNQGNRTYLPMPFAMVIPADSSRGWGFHVRTSRRTWFDVGVSDPDRLWAEVELDPDEAVARIDVAIYRGTPREVLAAFLLEVGRPTQPPDWVFRPWMSGNEWDTQARVEAEVRRSMAEGVPAGVVVVEAWSDETTFAAFRDARYDVHGDGSPHRLADFTFPTDGAWPDPRGLADWLHRQNIRLVLWQVPLLKTKPAATGQARADRDTMVARGYAVRVADGRPYLNRGWWFPGALMPDWTNAEARTWWLEKRRYLLEEVGVDGFKTDGGEHAWGADLRYADGSRGDVTNNRYPVLYSAAYHALMRSAGRDPVTFSRAGFTGAGSYPLHWAGDENSTWAALRASIVAGLTAATCGVFFWGWDLGGFSGEIPDAELYLRSAAMATFCPIMQYHSEFNHHRLPSRDRTPWNIAERTGNVRVLPIYRSFARVRDRLVPYLVEQAARSVDRCIPLMRPLFFDWPDDPATWDYPFQYLLGDELLVAPIVEPGVERATLYLPAGDWVDVWHGRVLEGGTAIEVDAPIDEIPVFARPGTGALAAELREVRVAS